ncbi:MAG: DUF1934 domain-containing protein [Acutalibacteraceae bacterium]
MEKDYLIKVVSHQNIEGESDDSEIITFADLTFDSGGYTVSYSQEDENGNPASTTIVVKDGSVSVIRCGSEITTNLMLEKGIRQISHHQTPYGSFSMGINTLEIDSDVKETGGRLYFKYATDIELSPLGEISFEITLKKRKGTDKCQ